MIATDSNPSTVEAPPTRRRTPTLFRQAARSGFSLIELLVVVAIMAILATLSVTSVRSILAGRAFTQALDTISNSATLARQMAVSRGLPVALVMADPRADDPRGLMIVQTSLDATGKLEYSPATPWRQLPSNNDVEIQGKDFLTDRDIDTGVQAVKLNGNPVSGYSYIMFYPDGSVQSAAATSPAVTLTQTKVVKNDYEITIQGSTGRVKVTNML